MVAVLFLFSFIFLIRNKPNLLMVAVLSSAGTILGISVVLIGFLRVNQLVAYASLHRVLVMLY